MKIYIHMSEGDDFPAILNRKMKLNFIRTVHNTVRKNLGLRYRDTVIHYIQWSDEPKEHIYENDDDLSENDDTESGDTP